MINDIILNNINIKSSIALTLAIISYLMILMMWVRINILRREIKNGTLKIGEQ